MTQLFLKLLNMSISASWLVLAVLLRRLLFRKAPKWISCLLWSLVALRLLLPFSFESAFSLIPSAEVIPQNIATAQTPAIYSGIPAVNSTVNPLFTQRLAPETHILETILFHAAVIWLAGAAVLLLYSAVSSWKLRRQVRASIQIGHQLYACDDVASPFIFGVLFPKIYVPSGIDPERLAYVLAHENAHLKRLDHWWKPLGFLLLTVYWFNPLLWLAYILLCRDIERACDEKVITRMDNAGKRGYSEALVACSVHRRMIMACPIAFGEVSVKARIKGILCYKKPSFWILMIALAACTATAVCFLTNPIPCRHDYSAEITVSPTCTQEGIQSLTCRLCDHCYTAPAPRLTHDFQKGDVLTPPDCTHPGSRELVCTGCGAARSEVMEPTGHALGTPFLSKEPNCAETGEMSAQCTLCHGVYVVEILAPNQNHDLHETVVKEATCVKPGEGRITCSRCDHVETLTYEPHGHNYVYGYTEPGTCTRNGLQEIKCTLCGDKYFEELPATGTHTWVASGNSPARCIYCGVNIYGYGNDEDYGLGSLLSSPLITNPPGTQLPSLKWDIAEDIRPKPG